MNIYTKLWLFGRKIEVKYDTKSKECGIVDDNSILIGSVFTCEFEDLQEKIKEILVEYVKVKIIQQLQ